MRVPLTWINELAGINASAGELAERLTFSGLEVEGVETFGAECRGIVAARILNIMPHPNAQKLQLCDIDAGGGAARVVCGARNFTAGDVAAFAPAGTVLPNGMKIENAKIRGEASCGMLCAEDELGISGDHSGLVLLPGDTRPGTPLSEVIGPPERVLIVEVTPNRPDCLSMMGIAREAAALYGKKLSPPAIDLRESDTPVESLASVVVKDHEGCPRYTARVLTGIRIGPAPLAMRLRLLQCGIRPINNVVDVTNYVLLEYGQPLHAFDRRLLGNGRIVVRRANPGETMATLDNVERRITPEMLVIADAARPVALAGVMGGAGSEIRNDTTEVLLESACFQAGLIRRTARAVGLSTESSYRFERGVDPALAEPASRRAAQLMTMLAGAALARGVIDIAARPAKPRKISCRFGRIRGLIGVDAPDSSIVEIFESLGLKTGRVTKRGCVVTPPSFRPDIEIEADLAEEFARMHGLDKIPSRQPRAACVSGTDDGAQRAMALCRNTLAGLGLSEIMNYSFAAQKLLDMFDPADSAARVALPNPVNADQAVLRPSLVPQLVQSLGLNMARQTAEAALFETGRVYLKDASGRLHEEERVAIGLMGPLGRPWREKRRPVEADEIFLWLKGLIESLCAAMKLGAPALLPASPAWAEPGQAARIECGSAEIGSMGIVKASIRSEWRMARPIAVFEGRIEPLVSRVFAAARTRPLAAYPAVVRDMAIIVGSSVRHEDVMKAIAAAAPVELTSVSLFDIYEGEGIGMDRKSLAYTFTYRSLERTLTDGEANNLHQAVKSAVARALNAEVREN